MDKPNWLLINLCCVVATNNTGLFQPIKYTVNNSWVNLTQQLGLTLLWTFYLRINKSHQIETGDLCVCVRLCECAKLYVVLS